MRLWLKTQKMLYNRNIIMERIIKKYREVVLKEAQPELDRADRSLVECLDTLSSMVVAVNRYIKLGQFTYPYVSTEETETVETEKRRAMSKFASFVINTLLDPAVARIVYPTLAYNQIFSINRIFRRSTVNERILDYETSEVLLDQADDKPSLKLSVMWHLEEHPKEQFDDESEKFKKGLGRSFPYSDIGQWTVKSERFPIQIKGTIVKEPKNRRDRVITETVFKRDPLHETFDFKAVKDLEPTDLWNIDLFSKFIERSRFSLGQVLGTINCQTITAAEAERLRKITTACLEGSALVQKTLNKEKI